MKNYQFILFDLDDTLLDFGAAEEQALPRVFAANDFPLTKDVEQTYKEINAALWRGLEAGTVTREQLMATRFAKTFEHYGRVVNGRALDTQYRSYLAESKVFVEGALEVIQALAPHFELFITSNGISDTQHIRLKYTGLSPYFKQVFVSEDTGYQKPMKPFFDYVFSHIANFDASKALIIGDSFNADIIGGHSAGIDTCWLNPERKKIDSIIQPTFEIQKIEELQHILLGVQV